LKYVDRCMINLGKNTPGFTDTPGYTQINGHTGTRISHQIRNPHNMTHNSKESEINENLYKRGFESNSGGSFDETYIDENLYLACQICKCIFILFEPISSPPISQEGVGVGPHFNPTDIPTNQGVLNKDTDTGANNTLQKNSPNTNLITNIQPLNIYKKGKKEILSISGKGSNEKHEKDISIFSNGLMLGK
jgi:hypothetical protein